MGLNFSPLGGWTGDRKPELTDSALISTAMAPSAVQAPFDRVVDGPASGRAAAPPRRSLRERLRWPLMFALPIVVAAFGGAYYLSEEPYVSTDDAFVRAAKVTVN